MCEHPLDIEEGGGTAQEIAKDTDIDEIGETTQENAKAKKKERKNVPWKMKKGYAIRCRRRYIEKGGKSAQENAEDSDAQENGSKTRFDKGIDWLYQLPCINAKLPKTRKGKEAVMKTWSTAALTYQTISLSMIGIILAAYRNELNQAVAVILLVIFILVLLCGMYVVIVTQMWPYSDTLIKRASVLGMALMCATLLISIALAIIHLTQNGHQPGKKTT